MVTRIVEAVLWIGVLWVVAVRPWVLDLPARVPLVQWIGFGACLLWWIRALRLRLAVPRSLAVSCVALLLAFAISSIWGHDRGEILVQGCGLVFGIALCSAAAHTTPLQRRRLYSVLIATGTLMSIYALWQAFVLLPALANLPLDQLAGEGLWQQVPEHTMEYATAVIHRRRVFGPFPLPGLLAAALIMVLPVSVAILKPWATTWARRLIAAAIWGVQTTALLLTQSLGGFASVCAATLLVLVLRRSSWRPKLAGLCVGLLSIGTLLVIRPELVDSTHPRNPIVQRWRYWMSTVQMIREHPLRGIGAGNYAQVYARYRRPLATDTRFAHNAILQVWAEWGVLGVVGLLGLMMSSLRLAARQPLGCHIAMWAFWLMALIDLTWSFPQLTCLWWPLLGLSMRSEGAEGGEIPSCGSRVVS